MSISDVRNEFPWLFFLITFVFSWFFWGLLIVIPDLAPFQFVITVIGAFGPTISAIFLTYRKNGMASVKKLLKRGIQYKIGWKWYVPILLLNPIVIFLGFSGAMIFTGQTAALLDISLIGTFIVMFIMLIPIMLPGGPLNEEFGWRGYALDRMQSQWNPVISSIILGLIWALWHLPLFFVDGMSQNLLLTYVPISALLFFLQVPTFSILYTWLHNNTGGSILTAILFHATWNSAFNVLMVSAFMQYGLTDPSQVTSLDAATMNALANLLNIGNLAITATLVLVVIFVIYKRGMSLRNSSES
jgi:membrane protease YdiL (CAAX protease family)